MLRKIEKGTIGRELLELKVRDHKSSGICNGETVTVK